MRQDTDKPRPGEGVEFQHIRRVTGWLSDSPSRWNNAKRAELAERVAHPLNGIYPPGAQKGTPARWRPIETQRKGVEK